MPSPAEMVLSIVQRLVDRPKQVTARWIDDKEGGHVEIKVAPEDRGKVIGKSGRNIQSLRQVATAAFGKDNQRIGIELAE